MGIAGLLCLIVVVVVVVSTQYNVMSAVAKAAVMMRR
jgi:hypothetical protein